MSHSICPSKTSEDTCSVNAECKWISPLKKCRKSRKRAECPQLKIESDCIQNQNCSWRSNTKKCSKKRARKVILTRKPISHESFWNENYSEKITPENRAVLAGTRGMINLQNYDTVINSQERGYRNDGVYIYYNNGLHPLSKNPDEYGSLPEWVETYKEDCGYSYFYDGLIDHNQLVPFKTSDWKIGSSKIMEVNPFRYAYTHVDVTTKLTRKDGAECNLVVPVMISAPWLGGPTGDVKDVGGGDEDNYNVEKFLYKNGAGLKLKYIRDKDRNKILIQPPQSDVIIPSSALEKAEKLVNHSLKSYFEATEYVYFNASGPCLFADDNVTINNVITDKNGFRKVIMLNLKDQSP